VRHTPTRFPKRPIDALHPLTQQSVIVGMPSRVRPQLPADGRIANQETDGVGDLGRLDQPLQLRMGKNAFRDELLAQGVTMGVSVKPGWITPQRTP